MTWWIWVIIIIYALGFVATFVFHGVLLQMVTFPLAVFRSFVWPIFWFTGWPSGSPLPMD